MSQVNNTLSTGLIAIDNNIVNGRNEKYPLAFEMQKGVSLPQGGFAKDTRIALLNNSQATFVMTLLKNNDVVVDFKVRLVEEFEKLAEKAKQAPTPALPFIFYLLTIASESPIIHLFNRFGLETRFDLSDYKMSPCRVSCAVFYCHVKASW